MSIYNRKLNWSLPVVILVFFLILLVAFSYIAIKMTGKTIFENEGPFFVFVSGLVPGLAVALIQFLLSWAEFQQISKFSKMRIKGVLNSRDGELYYGALISTAQTKIDVQGVTASRFVSDFADGNSSRDEKKLLIAALKNGVVVRFLLPEPQFLSNNDRIEKYPKTTRILTTLLPLYPNLEVRYFNHKPITSTVRVDDDVLFGPVFDNIESQNTPAVHTSASSALAQSYLNHFESEWSTARVLPRS